MFNIYYQTLATVAAEALTSPQLIAACRAQGVNPEDFQELREVGGRAAAADLSQAAAQRALALAQRRMDSDKERIDQAIRDISIRRVAVLGDLLRDAGASDEDRRLLQGFSFATPRVSRKTKAPKPGTSSKAQEAQVLQLTRLVSEILARPRVLAAYAGRGLDHAALTGAAKAAADLSDSRNARNLAHVALIEATLAEREAISEARRLWNGMRQGFARVARESAAAAEMLDRIARAREQSKTGPKRKPKGAAGAAAGATAAQPSGGGVSV